MSLENIEKIRKTREAIQQINRQLIRAFMPKLILRQPTMPLRHFSFLQRQSQQQTSIQESSEEKKNEMIEQQETLLDIVREKVKTNTLLPIRSAIATRLISSTIQEEQEDRKRYKGHVAPIEFG